jgi:hypothetical protein
MADKVNLSIDQGATFSADFTVNTFDGSTADLTGYTGAGQIRKHYTSNTATAFTLNVYANGTVRAALTANQTGNLTEGRYVYDIELTNTSDSSVTRLVEGIVTVTPQVTR